MRFHKLLAAIVLATVLLLTGCVKNSNPDAEKSTRVKYAKVYNPDGTLLVEGECSKARSGRHYAMPRLRLTV